MERYYNDKYELAVLISPGYGAGWSTQNDASDIAIDKRIVEYFMTDPTEDEMEQYLEEIGYGSVYMGGYDNIIIKWIPKGTSFTINQYDGAESINFNVITA